MRDIFDLADTWNAAGTVFTAIKMNVTDTSSSVDSLLFDLQIGGASRFSVRKDGRILGVAGSASNPTFAFADSGWGTGFAGMYYSSNPYGVMIAGASGIPFIMLNHVGATVGLGAFLGWSDVNLYRDAAEVLALRRGTNAQTFRNYGTYTDGSNYRRVQLAMTTAGVATLRAEGAGTGASGNVLHISSLPTVNPGPGILWNNAGTPAIGN